MANKSLAGQHSSQTILVTGGAGFIGSHTCVELLEQNYHVVIVDDLSRFQPMLLLIALQNSQEQQKKTLLSMNALSWIVML